MAAEVLFDAELTVNSVDLSAFCTSVTLNVEYDDIETTAFGDTLKTRIPGLGDGSVEGTLHVSYDSAETYATLQPLAGTSTTVVIKPNATDATAATNPQFTVTAAINTFSYINASVGTLHEMDFSWPLGSSIAIATS